MTDHKTDIALIKQRQENHETRTREKFADLKDDMKSENDTLHQRIDELRKILSHILKVVVGSAVSLLLWLIRGFVDGGWK